jgi:RNA polymerase sigma-70 factor (ECF subfamily)
MSFRTTVWADIRGAAEHDASASEAFVQRYRPPLLAYLRRRGVPSDDVEDVVQEVFLCLFGKDLLAKADRERGRFRSYLLGVTNNVLLKRIEKRNALKRGGGEAPISLAITGEVPAKQGDAQFDACWSEGLVSAALEQLAQENPRQYQVMQVHLSGKLTQQEIGAQLDRTAAQVKSDLHRARQRLVRLIKSEIARYASSEEEYRDEVRAFVSAAGVQDT